MTRAPSRRSTPNVCGTHDWTWTWTRTWTSSPSCVAPTSHTWPPSSSLPGAARSIVCTGRCRNPMLPPVCRWHRNWPSACDAPCGHLGSSCAPGRSGSRSRPSIGGFHSPRQRVQVHAEKIVPRRVSPGARKDGAPWMPSPHGPSLRRTHTPQRNTADVHDGRVKAVVEALDEESRRFFLHRWAHHHPRCPPGIVHQSAPCTAGGSTRHGDGGPGRGSF